MSATPTTRLRAAALLAVLAAASATPAQALDQQAEAARRDREAAGLFASIVADVVADKGRPFESCEIEAEWDTFPVPYAIAREAIGLEIHADLTNPRPIAALPIILGTAVAKDAVCDKAERERTRAARIANWEAAAKSLPGGSKPPNKPFFSDTFFSYPLFDRDFRRAVLVYGRQDHGHRLDDDGKPLSPIIKGFGAALVYARTGKTWHKVWMTYLYGQG